MSEKVWEAAKSPFLLQKSMDLYYSLQVTCCLTVTQSCGIMKVADVAYQILYGT